MFCTKCGEQIADNSKFCGKCGNGVNIKAEEELLVDKSVTGQQEELTQQTGVAQEEQQEWFFYDGPDKKGPFSSEQMIELIKEGKIQRETMVWTKSLPDWTTAGQSPLENKLGSVAPVAPMSMISDKWMWALAAGATAIRYIVAFLIVSFSKNPGSHAGWIVSACVIIANIFFLTKDIGEVQKTGRNVGAWLYTGVILVPVYLFVRAKNTTKNYWPLIVWCVINLPGYLL